MNWRLHENDFHTSRRAEARPTTGGQGFSLARCRVMSTAMALAGHDAQYGVVAALRSGGDIRELRRRVGGNVARYVDESAVEGPVRLPRRVEGEPVDVSERLGHVERGRALAFAAEHDVLLLHFDPLGDHVRACGDQLLRHHHGQGRLVAASVDVDHSRDDHREDDGHRPEQASQIHWRSVGRACLLQ